MREQAPRNLNIVVVDDEEIYLSLVRDALEEESNQVETASNAFDALKIIESTDVNLIITDIRMPQMDGIELVRRAKEINPHIGAIFMTGYANLNSAKNAIKQGAFDYISKPFELNEIRQAVKKATDKIAEEAAGSSSEKQLDRLSDLSQMLIEVGDKKALATTSVEFVMMHYGATCGAVIVWDKNKTNFRMITLRGNTTEESDLPAQPMLACLEKIENEHLVNPLIISADEDHRPETVDQACGFGKLFFPSWLQTGQLMINMPIRRAETFYGFLMIGPFEDAATAQSRDFKFLSITAGQLAVSLENLSLLEETREAYAKLKELQDETIQLEKMATRGEMSAEIGHELNNFLGVVAGNLSLLDFQLKKQNYADLDKYVHAITENVDKIKKFTSNLMELTPISSAKEIISFDKLIAEVIDYLKPQKRFNGVKIAMTPIEHPVFFEADVVHVQQVLLNLFNNAADATAGRDTREISVTVEPHSDKTGFSVTISDTGTGFAPDMVERAFKERFTTKENGHGFGLLVCRRIIENHGGTLQVASTP
ncbi:MAG: response regulator, partial [candidate division Zixibacteria bacterium]|nr:response regulator [candidate division Zixibacteria bacterium]